MLRTPSIEDSSPQGRVGWGLVFLGGLEGLGLGGLGSGFAMCSSACKFMQCYLIQCLTCPQCSVGIVMEDTFPDHSNNSYYRHPTFHNIGTGDPLGKKQLS